MNISCEVAKDLMPLCMDKLASADSEALVNEHTQTCENCADFYERMRKFVRVPITTDISPLKKMKRLRRKRILLCVILSLCILLAPLFALFIYDFTPIPLTYEEAFEGVYENEKNEIVATPAVLENVQWRMIEQVDHGMFVFGYRGNTLGFWTSYYNDLELARYTEDMLLCGERYIDEYGREQNRHRYTIYYVGKFAGEEDTLMVKKSDRAPVLEENQVGYTTVYLEIGAAVLTVVFALAWWFCRKKRWGIRLLYGSVFYFVWVWVTLFVTDGRMLLYYDRYAEGYLLEALDRSESWWERAIGRTLAPQLQYIWRHVNIALLTLLIWGAIVSAVSLVRMRKTDNLHKNRC